MSDVALVCGGGGALGGGDRRGAPARAATASSRSTGSPRSPVDGVRREAVDLTSADEVAALWDRLAADGSSPRWVVNAVGGFRGGRVARLGPGVGALRRPT